MPTDWLQIIGAVIVVWILFALIAGPLVGFSIRLADDKTKEHEMDEPTCPKTDLPQSWCQHCKTDDVQRRHEVLKPRRRGQSPHDIT
jgi:hypothetical protein